MNVIGNKVYRTVRNTGGVYSYSLTQEQISKNAVSKLSSQTLEYLERFAINPDSYSVEFIQLDDDYEVRYRQNETGGVFFIADIIVDDEFNILECVLGVEG